jgi:hypothetical protein
MQSGVFQKGEGKIILGVRNIKNVQKREKGARAPGENGARSLFSFSFVCRAGSIIYALSKYKKA